MVKCINLTGKTAIQDVGFRGIIKNILKKNDLKSIIYNVEDGSVIILIWGNDNIIDSAISQIQKEAKNKGIVYESQVKDLSADISPPSGVSIIEDTKKDEVRKFDKGIEQLTILAKHVQSIENLLEKEIRDIKKDIENALFNIKQDKISSKWDSYKRTIKKDDHNGFEINVPEKINSNDTEIAYLRSIEFEYIKILPISDYGITLILKDEKDLPDDNEITIWKQKTSDKIYPPEGNILATCKYGDIKRKFIPAKEIRFSSKEGIGVYLKTGIQKDVQIKDVIFEVVVCVNMEKEKKTEDIQKYFDIK